MDLEQKMVMALSAVDLSPDLAQQAAAVCAEIARQQCGCPAVHEPAPVLEVVDLPAAVPTATVPSAVRPVVGSPA